MLSAMSEGDDIRLPAPWLRYVTAFILSGAVFLVVVALPWNVPRLGLLLLSLLAVMLSAYAGGFGPGLLATSVGALTMSWLLPPMNSLHITARSDMVMLGIFASAGFLAAWALDWVNERV